MYYLVKRQTKLSISLERMIKNMAYVKNKNGFEIGDWATTTKKWIAVQAISKKEQKLR